MTPPMSILPPVHPQAEHGISSGIAGQLQDPEQGHQMDYTSAVKAACVSHLTASCSSIPQHAHPPVQLTDVKGNL